MRISVKFIAGEIIDNTLYFSNLVFNGLFKMDLSTNKIEFIGSFDEAPSGKENIHRKCLVYKRWLIFIPQDHNVVNLFNVDTQEQKTIKITDEDTKQMIADAVLIGDLLYIIPARKEQSAFIAHLDDLNIEVWDRYNDWFRTEVPDSPHKSGIITVGAALSDNMLFIGLYGQNGVIRYDLNRGSISRINTDIEKINRVFAGKDGIWLTDLSGGHIELLYDAKQNYEKDNSRTFGAVVDSGKSVYAIPGNAARIKIIKGDKAPKEMEYPEEFRDLGQSVSKTYKFYGYIVYNEDVYLFPYAHDNILVIHEDQLRVIKTEYEIDPSDPASEQIMKLLNARGSYQHSVNGMIQEDSTYPLEAYLEWIKTSM